ncbi:peroxisome biogenesis factor 2 isoform X2 [Paramormyrops kingsleyae]|uniref:peroxisome biogenesis factor 2 isoform X2 n=2 Tax=Paramormyrops kingsleyae TaxID=1676925 RepID=UPI003B976E35
MTGSTGKKAGDTLAKGEARGGDSFAEDDMSASTPVLRISQLDAYELDTALEQLVWTQLSRCFQYFKPGFLTPCEAELKALLQLLLWRFTVYSHGATVGQSLLNIRYCNDVSQAHGFQPLIRRQKLWFGLWTIGEKWLKERAYRLFLNRPAESPLLKVRRILDIFSGVAKVASLLNFLHFLRRGRFPTLTERLLGMRVVFAGSPGAHDVGYQYVNRELLWHGFAEFLIFLLPLVGAWRLRARALLAPPQRELGPPGTECALCGEWPTMAHTAGCRHVFCYYCIKSHMMAEVSFSCPCCGQEAQDLEPVKIQMEMTRFQ